jgi:hypothetical protein
MKRNLFDELKEGLNALQSAREGKVVLRQHEVKKKPALSIVTGHTNYPSGVARSNAKIFVERRPEGDYAVRRANSTRASAVLPTQAEAIERARKLSSGASPLVERVRHTSGGKPDKWRKA